MIINNTATISRPTGNDAAVTTTRITVDKVRSPIRMSLGPTFRKTPVVTANARKMNALAVSVSCVRSL